MGTRYSFNSDFLWGVATSSYQIEGAWNEDGKSPSIWDTFVRQNGTVSDASNADVACDSYHKIEEDIQLIKGLGVKVYRFSLSWPRIIPTGQGELNLKGLNYYDHLVNRLIEEDILPFCTLYHWDLPQILEDNGGWQSRETAVAFAEFSAKMFQHFKGRIKHWLTINEPWCAAFLGYFKGEHAPGIKDLQSSIAAAHNLIVAHGLAVKAFRDLKIEGQIGIAPNITWQRPFTRSEKDLLVCQRGIQWSLDWFLDPIFFGHYPQILEERFKELGISIPDISKDLDIIKQPIDFLAGNYYSSSVNAYKKDGWIFESEEKSMGLERSDIGWNFDPAGFYESLRYIQNKYGNIPLYITENGLCDNTTPKMGKVNDVRRVNYYRQHLASIARALADGINVKGYMAWSLMDNFEWAYGYSMRFGLVWVDFRTLERIKKESYYWYAKVIKEKVIEA